MMFKFLLILALATYASAALSHFSLSLGHLGGGGGLSHIGGGLSGGSSGGEEHHGHKIVDYYTKPHYEYNYAVHDPHHHDIHEQHEKRYGDKVMGEYSLHEPDGTIRVVKYEADHHNGFNAIVERKGHAVHPHIEYHHHH